MIRVTFLPLLLIIILTEATSQESNAKTNNDFNIKRDQLTMDFELFAIGFAGTRALGQRTGLGLGFQFGYGLKYIINDPLYLYCGGGCDSGDCCAIQNLKAAYDVHAEIIKVNLFWRYYLTPKTILNAGIFGSVGQMPGGDKGNDHIFTGFQFDFFTGLKKLKLGIKTQAGSSFLSYSSDKNSSFFLVSVTPAIQLHF